jgi:acyl carrier protein
MSDVALAIKQLVLTNFLPTEDAANLQLDTQLVTTGVIDSLSIMRLVTLLEENFGIQVEAHEATADNLDTIQLMAEMVDGKRKA